MESKSFEEKFLKRVSSIKKIEIANIKKDKYKLESNILIFSSPRSGSTWLTEILNHIDYSAVFFEPLYPLYVEFAQSQYWWRPYLPETQKNMAIKKLFKLIFEGKYLYISLVRGSSVETLRKANFFIIKFCRANMLLPWLINNFNLRLPIYLIRHPLGFVSSALRFAGFRKPKFNYPYNPIIKKYEHIFKKLNSIEEILAFRWCVDNIIPLKHPANNKRWITVSYEKLLVDPGSELSMIFNRLNEKLPEIRLLDIKKPSSATIHRAPILSGGDQLTVWKHHLDSSQVKAVLKTVEKFDIDCYSEAVEPEYSKIYNT